MSPKAPDGILDIRGPSTLEGGYSPSQDISSAMAREVVGMVEVEAAVLVRDAIRTGLGVNADAMAMSATRRTMESLAILIAVFVYF